jgi:Domain of unknown function (DUF4304)
MTYSVKEIFEEIRKEIITPLLKAEGYKKQHYNYRKVTNGLTYLINFQSSGYNSVDYAAYYVNCGIYCADFETTVGEKVITSPKEYNCLFNQRIERITNWDKKSVEIIESSEEGKKRIADELIIELRKLLLFFDKIKSIADLVKLCIQEGTFFETKLTTYLCLKKEMELLDKQFQNYAEWFKDDERYLFFENKLNNTLKAHGIAPMQFRTKMSVPIELQRKFD